MGFSSDNDVERRQARPGFETNSGPEIDNVVAMAAAAVKQQQQHSDNDMIDVIAHDGREDEKTKVIRNRNPVLRYLSRLNKKMAKLDAFEAQGVERVPEHQRRPPQKLNMLFLWFSLLLSPTFIPIGMLGPIFGLSVHTSIVLTVFGSLTGASLPAFTATLCPATGLRQIAVARYSLGIWGARLSAALNVVINVGYGTIAAVVGGQLLRAVSGGGLSLVVGIVLVVVVAWAISFFGYAVVHIYERYAWVLGFVLLCVLYAQASRFFAHDPAASSVQGATYSGACLTYFAVVFGVGASWCPISGDYYVHYPADTSRWLVLGLTYAGIALPSIFVGVLGNYFGGAIFEHEDLGALYESAGVGGLILEVMSPPRAWARFACVMFTLTFLANVTANIYSSALSLQLLHPYVLAVPRFVLCTLLGAAIFALAYGGRNVLEDILENLLPILGYWTLAFGLILFIEHFWFRRPRSLGGYDLDAWSDPVRLPVGFAGTASLLVGIAFSFLGMAQTWYVAPVAKRIGMYGGDVGDELTLVSVLICYPILRTLEIRYTGR